MIFIDKNGYPVQLPNLEDEDLRIEMNVALQPPVSKAK